MEGLRLLKNKLQVAQFFNTSYNKEFKKEFPIGDTLTIKKPQQFQERSGLGYAPQALSRQTTTVVVDQLFGIDFEWDSVEAALTMERGAERIRETYLEPAMATLAQSIDSRAALWAYQHTNNVVGALGTDPTDMTVFGAARQRLVELAAPGGKRGVIIPPQVNTSMVNAMKGLFQADDEISKQYKDGTIGKFQGFRWFESMSLYSHTAGTWAGAVTVAGANQSGSSLVVNCTSGDTFKKGDKIGIGGTFAVNPMTKRITTTAQNKQVSIMADTTATSTTATIQISPAISFTAPYQNISALPANGAALTLWPGTTAPNGKTGKVGVALTDQAFALVGVDLEIPKAAEVSSRTRDPETGISVAFVRMFDPQQRKMINRFDVLLGFGDLYPDNGAVAIASA